MLIFRKFQLRGQTTTQNEYYDDVIRVCPILLVAVVLDCFVSWIKLQTIRGRRNFFSSLKCNHKQVISIYIPVRVSSIPPNFRWPCLYVNKLFFNSRETSSLETFFMTDAKRNALPCYFIQITRVSQLIDLSLICWCDFDLVYFRWYYFRLIFRSVVRKSKN